MPSASKYSVCALDCPDACSLLIDVEDGRGSRLRGNPTHPVTRGFLCGKVAKYLDREYSPDRLLYPQRRQMSPRVRVFIDWLSREFARHPEGSLAEQS